MSELHAHAWTPVPGECARYACGCGVVGFRDNNGRIRVAEPTAALDHDLQITARPTADYRTGRVRARRPDDWELWQYETEI